MNDVRNITTVAELRKELRSTEIKEVYMFAPINNHEGRVRVSKSAMAEYFQGLHQSTIDDIESGASLAFVSPLDPTVLYVN